MKKIFLVILLFSSKTIAQQTEGVITYERVSYWTKIIGRLPYLSKEEKDRAAMTWSNEDGNKEKMLLKFNQNESNYTYEKEQGESEDGSWSWRNDEYVIYRDFEHQTKTEVLEMLGKTHLLQDSLATQNWKIMNQIKDIAGYICMKAVTEDTIKKQKITAWFCGDLPIPLGPERFYGLPGAILELEVNDGDVVITALKVELKKNETPLKITKTKGKKINEKLYNTMIEKHIKDSVKSFRNPYWAMRY
jgi:GLPGLI family protein